MFPFMKTQRPYKIIAFLFLQKKKKNDFDTI